MLKETMAFLYTDTDTFVSDKSAYRLIDCPKLEFTRLRADISQSPSQLP